MDEFLDQLLDHQKYQLTYNINFLSFSNYERTLI